MAKVSRLHTARLKSETALTPPDNTTSTQQAQKAEVVTIKKPNFMAATVEIFSTTPYVQNRFSARKQDEMVAKQKEGSSKAKTKRAKPPKNFELGYLESMHESTEGWRGIPCMAIKCAMVDSCRLVEMDMVRAKMCIFVVSDGLDKQNAEGLVRINGEPEMFLDRVRIGISQTDVLPRAMWKKWSARVRIEWDADVFTSSDIINLLARAGKQVGIGAGRTLSKMSCGTGKGQFRVAGVSDVEVLGDDVAA